MKFVFIWTTLLLLVLSCTPGPQSRDDNVLQVALWDTEICPTQHHHKRIEIMPAQDFSGDSLATEGQRQLIKKECQERQQHFYRSIHGQYMLDEVQKMITTSNPVKIRVYPLKVFSRHGHTSALMWQQALSWLKDNSVHLHLMGTALPLTRGQWQEWIKINPLPQGVILAAAPTFGAGIDQSTWLWPQDLQRSNDTKNGQLLIIAGVFQDPPASAKETPPMPSQGHFDPTILRPEAVDWTVLLTDQEGPFGGNSQATARAAGHLLETCLTRSFSDKTNIINIIQQCNERWPRLTIKQTPLSNNYLQVPIQ